MTTRRRAASKALRSIARDSDRQLPLPHERDETTDAQATAPAHEMKRAHADVASGQVDTDDRGVQAVQAFRAVRSGRTKPRQ
jgi:hypothetical protein